MLKIKNIENVLTRLYENGYKRSHKHLKEFKYDLNKHSYILVLIDDDCMIIQLCQDTPPLITDTYYTLGEMIRVGHEMIQDYVGEDVYSERQIEKLVLDINIIDKIKFLFQCLADGSVTYND